MKNENFELRNVKGTFDFLPNEQSLRNKIIDVLKENFTLYGYEPLETPILNEFDLLKYKYGEGAEILNEIYRLTDQGKRDLGLRYDLTVPFCKVIGLNKDLTMPFRRYEIGRVFRDGPVKLGRTREFYQCDVDVVGIDGRFIEVEQMQMVASVFDKLNIDVVIKWNNRKLMVGILENLGYADNQFDTIIGLIDRIEKVSFAELISEFDKAGINEQKANELLNAFSLSLDEYAKIAESSNVQNLKDGIAECLEVDKLIKDVGLSEKAQFSPKLARGLGIYTGTVFEFFDKEKRLTSSLGGGGRYNKIITEFMDNGQEYPAVGLSFGLEPIYAILKNDNVYASADVFIIPMGTEVECMQLAKVLRENGAKVLVDYTGKKVRKAFDYANKTHVPYVICVGENEVNSKTYALKNMTSGEQVMLKLDELVEFLKKTKK